MQTFKFTIRIEFIDDKGNPSVIDGDDLLERIEGPLFEEFGGDVTPSVADSMIFLDCAVAAPQISGAIGEVAKIMTLLGLGPSGQARSKQVATVEMPLPLEDDFAFAAA